MYRYHCYAGPVRQLRSVVKTGWFDTDEVICDISDSFLIHGLSIHQSFSFKTTAWLDKLQVHCDTSNSFLYTAYPANHFF